MKLFFPIIIVLLLSISVFSYYKMTTNTYAEANVLPVDRIILDSEHVDKKVDQMISQKNETISAVKMEIEKLKRR